jgi:hypothetical protein
MMRGTHMKVLYIVGVGRSGSTLLERALGAVPGSVNVGELNAIFSRVSAQDQRCGCGETFSGCAFWHEVGDRAFGGWGPVTERVTHLQPRVVRQRFVPLIATGLAGATYRRELDEYLDVYRRLYEAILAVSAAEVVVDASKSTAQLFALCRLAELDLRVVNLVRDSRGVANSWSKPDVPKPQSQQGGVMGTYSPPRLAVLWAALQLESAAITAATPHSTRLRYEDLVENPRASIERTLRDVDLAPAAGALDHVGAHSVTLPTSHGVAGSRTRFTTGDIELRIDDSWHTALPQWSQAVVTALTLPQLLRYGYVGPRTRTETVRASA